MCLNPLNNFHDIIASNNTNKWTLYTTRFIFSCPKYRYRCDAIYFLGLFKREVL